MRGRHCAGALAVMISLTLSPALTSLTLAQRGGPNAASAPARPAPKTPDGRVILGSPPGQLGLWMGADNRLIVPEKQEEVGLRDGRGSLGPAPGEFPKPRFSQVPFQPWSRSVYMYRLSHEFEPYTRCKPAGGMR